MKTYFVAGASLLLLCICTFLLNACSSTQHMKDIYGIKNIKTGKGLRPYNAYWWVGNRLVLYDYKNWKCMTWQFVKVGEKMYTLQNLSTGKTFEAKEAGIKGSTLRQERLVDIAPPIWVFIKQGHDSYYIKQADTELYLTVASNKTNSNILLMPKENTNRQLWQLIEQHPQQ